MLTSNGLEWSASRTFNRFFSTLELFRHKNLLGGVVNKKNSALILISICSNIMSNYH